jgi:glycosyltransferase involved in cell wall biosynthesis
LRFRVFRPLWTRFLNPTPLHEHPMPEIPSLPPIADQPLSVVLLARNAADHVVASLIVWLGFLDDFRPGNYELILVDDGSSDGTADKAQAQADAFPVVRVVRLDQPRGEGAALRAGLQAATKPLVFYTLCEPAYRPEILKQLFAQKYTNENGVEGSEIDHVHLMTGFRAGRKVPSLLRALGWLARTAYWVMLADSLRPLPGRLGWRRQLGWVLSRLLFGVRTRDVTCPVRLLRREILPRIPIQSDGPFAHVELLAKANFLGMGGLMGEEVPLDVVPPAYRGDAGVFFRDGQKVFNKPDFGPAVLPAAAPPVQPEADAGA